MGLNTSWWKTKVQNTGYGLPPITIQVMMNTVKATESFTYLGSATDSSGRSSHDVHHRIGLASSVMDRLYNIWRQPRLSLSTKLRLYNVYVVSVLLYSCETWVSLQSDERRFEAFHMTCHRRILGVRWHHFDTNTGAVLDQTTVESIMSRIQRRRKSVFDHVRRLPKQTPAHAALCLAVDTHSGRKRDNKHHRRHPRGRPRRTWIQQIEVDSGLSAEPV